MSGLSFIGSYSGIDRSTIDKLMEVERLPLRLYNSRKTSITEQQKAWKDINTRLNSLSEKIDALRSADTITSMKATSTNEDKVSISTSNKAVAGTYRINVTQLATSNSIIGNKVSGELEKGSFAIKNAEGTKEYVIDIEDVDTLESVAKKINAVAKDRVNNAGEKVEGSGINASVINGQLVLTDEKEGKRNIELKDDVNGTLGKLGLEGKVYAGGEDSIFSVNGVTIEGKSNSVSDVIEGLTINLKEVGSVTVTVGTDYEKSEKAMQEFVDQYNSTMKFIEEKLAAGDPEVAGSAGTLSGDGTLMRLHSTLRSLVTSVVSKENGAFGDISQLGVSTKDRYGELQFDVKKFRAALAEDPNKVKNFFSSTNVNDEEIGYVANINKYIGSFISEKNGIIKGKNETFEKTLKDINDQIEKFEARMVKKEELYIKRFTALDVAMMKAEGQMDWLVGQVNAMSVKK